MSGWPHERTLLVGGLSSLHDPLLAAALRATGADAVVLHPRTDHGMRAARALGNHGQCNPAQYAVGAVLEHSRASGLTPEAFAARHAWLTVGSCGPCRLAAYPLEFQRVLAGAGLGALPVVQVEQLAFAGGPLPRSPVTVPAPSGLFERVLEALVAGDVVTALGHRARPFVNEPEELADVLADGAAAVARALEAHWPVDEALAGLAEQVRALPSRRRVLPRVVLVGEPWTTLADGDPSYDLAARIEAVGAEVDAPLAVDWLRYLLHSHAAAAADAVAPAERELASIWQRLALAARIEPELADPAELARLAAPHYAPAVRGGSAHLEIGRVLRAMRRGPVHLVLSLKPFGCLPSSALSDGVLAPLLRSMPGGPAFLAIETTGDCDATVDGRVAMALEAATLRALNELPRLATPAGAKPAR